MPSARSIVTIAVISAATFLGLQHYQAKKG